MGERVVTCLIFGGMAAVAGLLFYVAYQEQKQWQEFARTHDCRVVGKVAPSTSFGVGISSSGSTTVVPITTPEKTGYACDDGATYWR